MRSAWRTLNDLLKIGVIALVAAAILQELGTPAEKRTWHGKLAGRPVISTGVHPQIVDYPEIISFGRSTSTRLSSRINPFARITSI